MYKSRIQFYLSLLLMLLVPISGLHAAKSDYTVVMILWRGITDAERGFMDYLKSDGLDVKFIIKDCNKDKKLLPQIISEVKEINPDLVYTFGTSVTSIVAGLEDNISAEKNITTIPIVFNIVSNPVAAGISHSLSSTNRNLTGVSHTVPMATQMKVIKQSVNLKKLAFLYNPMEKNSMIALQELKSLNESMGFELIDLPITYTEKNKPSVKSISTQIELLANHKPDFIYLPSDSFLIANSDIYMKEVNKYKIPSFSSTEGPIRKSGALMGVVSTYYSVGKFAGFKAKQILVNKIKAKNIPIQKLKRFSFLVDINTAKKINFIPSISMLSIAEIIGE